MQLSLTSLNGCGLGPIDHRKVLTPMCAMAGGRGRGVECEHLNRTTPLLFKENHFSIQERDGGREGERETEGEKERAAIIGLTAIVG